MGFLGKVWTIQNWLLFLFCQAKWCKSSPFWDERFSGLLVGPYILEPKTINTIGVSGFEWKLSKCWIIFPSWCSTTPILLHHLVGKIWRKTELITAHHDTHNSDSSNFCVKFKNAFGPRKKYVPWNTGCLTGILISWFMKKSPIELCRSHPLYPKGALFSLLMVYHGKMVASPFPSITKWLALECQDHPNRNESAPNQSISTSDGQPTYPLTNPLKK